MAYNLKSETDVKEYLTNLGIEYRFGCFSEKNPEVCHLLGDYLEAIDKDFDKAARVYKANCDDSRYAKSCYKIASYLLLGKGVKGNFEEGYRYAEKGCNLDHAEACLTQGLLLTTNNEEKGIDRDIVKGMKILEKACLARNANACYYLSGMYISGVKKQPLKTEVQHGKRCDSGNDYDHHGDNNGGYQVRKDMKRAFEYALEGCNLKNIYSCANLSQMYSKGEGVEKNAELAEKYRKITLEMQEELTTQKTLTFGQGLQN